MKIRFRQTGGFAGLVKSAEIDTEQLPPAEAEQLTALVTQANFFELPEPTAAARPDEEQYTIAIESGGRSRELHLGHLSIPAQLKPLVDRVAKRAQYEKRR
jgi:hypothetical protein